MASGDTNNPPLLELQAALERLPEWITPLVASERISLHQATGRVLSTDIKAPAPLPGFDHSAMDGFALRSTDLESQPLSLRETVLAGASIPKALASGECVRVMTGAPVPGNTDQVVMQEQARVDTGGVFFKASAHAGEYLRRRGEDLATGDTLFKAGQRLGAAQLGLLASLGLNAVHCRPQPRVALLSTGDELVEPGQELAPGQRHDANRSLLSVLLHQDGARVADHGIVADQPAALRQALDQASEECDLLLSSGGVSAGVADHLPALLKEAGEVAFWKLRIKPGMPLLLGRWRECPVCCLPGNPVSALNTYLRLVRPALACLTGEKPSSPWRFQARLSEAIRRQPGREEFARGQLHGQPDDWRVRLLPNQSSGRLTSLVEGNCFVHLPAELDQLAAGSVVTVEPFNWPLVPSA